MGTDNKISIINNIFAQNRKLFLELGEMIFSNHFSLRLDTLKSFMAQTNH